MEKKKRLKRKQKTTEEGITIVDVTHTLRVNHYSGRRSHIKGEPL